MDHVTSDPDRNTPAVRASDTERQATALILQQAFAEGRLTLPEFDDRTAKAYQARFRTDLAELTADLSPAGHHLESPPTPRPDAGYDRAPSRRVTGGTGPATSLAVLGGRERKGPWTLPAAHTAVAIMGGVELDLREASLESHESTIRAFALWGGIEILVPEDIEVIVEGLGLMGGFAEEGGTWSKDPRPVRQAPPGAPRIRITGFALMGGIGIRRVPRD